MEAVVEQLGPYRIIEEIGRGGMGVVYRAKEDELNRTVALKVLNPELLTRTDVLDRFRREAQSAAQLNHPNIVQIHRFESNSEPAYFAMEFVEGRNLQEVIRERGRLSVAEAAGLILQAAHGLARAHDMGIVHRDIKPANLMLDGDGLLKIADFGVAYVHDATHRLTQSGALIGTPHYLSPEQCLGDPIDGRADIYSLGVSFFELVTGRVPFDADTPLALLRVICEVEPPDPRLFAPSIGDACCTVLRRMLAKSREHRYPDCTSLIADLETLATSTQRGSAAAPEAHPAGHGGPFQYPQQTPRPTMHPVAAQAHAGANAAMQAHPPSTPSPTSTPYPAQPEASASPVSSPVSQWSAPMAFDQAHGPQVMQPPIQTTSGNNAKWFALAGGMGLLGLGLLALALRPSAPPPATPAGGQTQAALAAHVPAGHGGSENNPPQPTTPAPAAPAPAKPKEPAHAAKPKPNDNPPEKTKQSSARKSGKTKAKAHIAGHVEPETDNPWEPQEEIRSAPPKRVEAPPPQADADPRRTAVIADLRSPLPKIRRRGAKLALRYYHSDAGVLQVAERELRKGYAKVISGKHSDSMAWICRLLGASGDPRYKPLLLEVATKAHGNRLRGHAAKAASYL